MLGRVKTMSSPIGERHQRQHDRHLNQYTDDCRQRCTRVQSKQGDRHSNSQFEEIGGTDHAGRRRDVVRQFQLPCCEIRVDLQPKLIIDSDNFCWIKTL